MNELYTLNSAEDMKNFVLKHSGMVLLGMDFGLRKMGLALSDTTFCIASPYSVYNRISYDKDAIKLLEIINKRRVCAIVTGLSLGTNNQLNEELHRSMCKLLFTVQKKSDVPLPVYMQDERFSTSRSITLLKSIGINRRESQLVEDKIAASYILQDALDAID